MVLANKCYNYNSYINGDYHDIRQRGNSSKSTVNEKRKRRKRERKEKTSQAQSLVMDIEQYIIVFCYVCLFFNKASRKGAFILCAAFIFYDLFIVGSPWYIYYAAAATLNLLLVLALSRVNFYAMLCSLSLIFINIYGFTLCYNRYSVDSYNQLSLLVLIIQLITITPKGLLSVLISRFSLKRPMVRASDFDSGQARVIMCKNKTQKEADK